MNQPVKDQQIPSASNVQLLLDTGRRLNQEARKHPDPRGYPFLVVQDGDGTERAVVLGGDSLRKQPDYWQTTVSVDDAKSFIDYFREFDGSRQVDGNLKSRIYASLSPAQFIAVLNDHRPDTPSWRDHRVVFQPKHSPEWLAWMSAKDKPFAGNVAWAEWLEDQHFDIVDPPGATMLEIALNFRVTDNVAFSNPTRLANGRTEFSFQRIVDGHAQGSAGKIEIPEQFTISIPVWAGLNQQTYPMQARLRYRLKDSGLTIWYTLIRPHKVLETAFSNLLETIEQRTGTVLFGNPDGRT